MAYDDSYESFQAAVRNGSARTVFQDGSTLGVYTTPSGKTAYWHICYGDHRQSYATDGFNEDGQVWRIPAAE